MRRHSSIPEKSHNQIRYKSQNSHYTNEWVEESSKRNQNYNNNKKKTANRKNLDDTMTASVLPARNAYNDYHVKYHSVSGGSALSQSMKYAEAWLYGSLNVRPSIRATFLNFDRDFAQGFDPSTASVTCYCSSQNSGTVAATTTAKKKTCKKYSPSFRNFATVQGFGTMRGSVTVHRRNEERAPTAAYKDPYDIVRQSRLAGIKNATVRVESNSLCKRKHIPSSFVLTNRRSPSPSSSSRRATTNDENSRKSILECPVNAYDLVRKNADDDGSSLISDDDLLDDGCAATKSNKKSKSALKSFKLKLQDSKPAKMIIDNFKKIDKLDASAAAEDVSIAGQKIRVFASSPANRSSEREKEDWITDSAEDHDAAATAVAPPPPPPMSFFSPDYGDETRRETPKRPPRRKTQTPKTSSKSESEDSIISSSGIYENYEPAAKHAASNSSGTAPGSDIKSILKKPLATSSAEEAEAVELNNFTSPAVATAGGGDFNENFYLTTFNRCSNKRTDRKVKKQVQFKGMQERTVEDESGSNSNVDVAETGYCTENATTTPERQYSDRTLTANDDKSNADDHLLDYERKVTSLPLSQNERGVARYESSVHSRGSSAENNDTFESKLRKSCNGEFTEPVSCLHRTLSACITPRPLRLNLQCEPFNDTMRLRVRANHQQIDPKRLFHNDRRVEKSANIRRMCSRPAVPPPLPPITLLDEKEPKPYLPPRQYFPFNKPDNLVVSKIPNGTYPIIINVNEETSIDNAKIPSLTKTFLQNRTLSYEREKSNYSASIIKINVPPEEANFENRTIVTISPDEDENPEVNPSNKTSITINFDDRSPSAECQNNTVTINVGYENAQNFTNNIRVTPDIQSEITYVKTESQSTGTEMSTQTENDAEFSRCSCDKQSDKMDSDSIDETSNSSGGAQTSNEYCKSDFSLHYMSCKINEKLTEDEVGFVQNNNDEHEYDLSEPIYEEISEAPPPLPLEPPPEKIDDVGTIIPPRSIFEGASKYDILKYLAGAKERCKIPEEAPIFEIEELADLDPSDLSSTNHSRIGSLDLSSRNSHLSNVSDSSDELVGFLTNNVSLEKTHKNSTDIERNDSGVGSETSKCSRSKWQHIQASSLQEDQQHICEDCDQPVEAEVSNNGLTFAPLVCRKCSKKRIERREIIAEIVETEEKYGRDLHIILDEFYKPMLVAGLLTPEQLISIFLNVEELLEHNTALAEKLRDGYEIAIEQGDEDLLTFNVGKMFLEAAPMLHAFESYCTRQGNAALLLANLEKEKELLKIFLRVSQMENTVLRRMNLNSFLMVPVQRVTKYPLLLARLYKVTPEHHTVQRELLKEAQHNIELHLEHINSLTKDIGSMKIWRRISMMNGRRVSGDAEDILNIKLQKIAVEVLEWGHEDVRFVVEGRLFYAQPTDYNWKRVGRTIKVIPVNALLVTLGKPTENYNPDCDDSLMFPQKNGIREASLLLMKEKGGKYSLVRDPLFLDHCIIYCDNDCEEYFEVQEIQTKDTYIFKGEDEERTKHWYKQLQYHSQGLGFWRKRRNALANIMINGVK